jgi:micrococcal nuclease
MKHFISRSLPAVSFLLTAMMFVSCEFLVVEEEQDAEWRKVVKVVDGDTIHLEDPNGEKPERVRLIGMDAPETRRSAGKEPHAFGPVSKAYLSTLLADGRVRLEYDVRKTDRYGRTLAYVYLPDGTFVNAKMIEEGYAVLMTIQPNSKYADFFAALQSIAREQVRGLWALEVN